MNKQEFFIKRLESNIASEQAQIDKFVAKVQEDPAYALSWGTNAFASAANLKVFKLVLTAMTREENPCTMQDVKNTLMDRVLQRSKYPPQSTSPCSNLMEQYELAAYANMLSDLNMYME